MSTYIIPDDPEPEDTYGDDDTDGSDEDINMGDTESERGEENDD